MKKYMFVMIAIVLMLSACSLGQSESSKSVKNFNSSETIESGSGTRTIIDTTGRNVEIPEEVKSIVCVNVSTLRFTTYMQATDLLIGVEENEHEVSITKPFNYINQELFASLPSIGNNGTTYDEEIIKLSPDVVVASYDKEAADSLQKKLGIPVVAVPLIDSMFDEQCYDVLTLMGDVYGREERAEELISFIKELQEDLSNRVAGITEEEKPRVYAGGISFKGNHGFDGTEANYAPFSAINAHNLANDLGQPGAFSIDLEQVLNWDPEIIFLDFNGMSLINEDYTNNSDYYNSLTAVKEGRLYSQISFRTNAMNAELALADAYYAGKVIYPEEFHDVDPIEKADEIFEKMLGTKFYGVLKESGYEFKKIKLGE